MSIAEETGASTEDLFGTRVIEAARIAAAAKGGEILVSNVVRELAKGKDFVFADRGKRKLRGFQDAVRLYEVRWPGGGLMEPRIQYAQTADGVSIAYWTIGGGQHSG